MGKPSVEDNIPWFTAILSFTTYITVILMGHFHEFVHRVVLRNKVFQTEPNFVPLISPKEYFYTRWMFGRIRDCWDRPICSTPAGKIEILERKINCGRPWFMDDKIELTGRRTNALNLGSYNYLGFAQKDGKCIDAVVDSVKKYGVGSAGTRRGVGTFDIHEELDIKVAEFVGKEAAITFGMGYATNSANIPVLIGKGGLVISDALNHASIVVGCRGSGAKIKVFKHNDPKDLENVLRQAIAEGQPRTHRPWKKILIVVEGIYSMEGEICCLPEIIAIKKKYKAYLYVDEAHSIGALGKKAKGVCDYYGVNPDDVDVLMGTFTKSFGSIGGYIAGSKELITYLKQTSFANTYATSMSIGCAQMVLAALNVITGADGTDEGERKVRALKENSNYFRRRLREEGFRIMGDSDSPIIPLLLYHPAKIALFSRECLKAHIAVVVVGFPAVPLLACRTRFCMSADHDIETLERAIQSIARLGDKLLLKYGEIPGYFNDEVVLKTTTKHY